MEIGAKTCAVEAKEASQIEKELNILKASIDSLEAAIAQLDEHLKPILHQIDGPESEPLQEPDNKVILAEVLSRISRRVARAPHHVWGMKDRSEL